jgi:hypothetical protein
MAKYVPLSRSLRILLSLIPVREVIHSSFVSTIVSRLCLKEQSQEHRLNSVIAAVIVFMLNIFFK